MNEKRYYIAYGSNLNVPQMRMRCPHATIATILEYGKSGQPAKPFLKPARSSSRNACINAMKAKLDEEVEKI